MSRFIFLTENVNILIHSVVYLFLVCYPYQNRTRFSKKTTVILCAVYTVVDAVIILSVVIGMQCKKDIRRWEE
ncbi:MAG: hypothetical protein PHQ72_01675 [Hespellia sp.]|nr:hypothetical protein [Hespellia sp.]